jgi:hypothetical protein
MVTISYTVGTLAFMAFFALNLLALRLRPKSPPVVVFLACSLTVHLLASLTAGWAFRGISYWHGAALYWFAFIGYLYGYSALQKSISLRTLRALYARADLSADLPTIYSQTVRRSFLERVDLLVQGGLAAVQDGRYAATESARKTARRVALARRLFGVVSSGLYFDTGPPR